MKKDKFIWFACMILYGVLGIASFILIVSKQVPSNNHYINTSLYDINTELSKTEDNTVPVESDDTVADELPAEPVTEEIQYSFVSTNMLTVLHVRKEPDLNSEIIYYLNPQSTGDIIEKGDSWSLIQYGNITGYVSNDYLEFHEKN